MDLAYSLLMFCFIDSASAHGFMMSPKIRGDDDYNKNGFWAKVDDKSNRCPGFGGRNFGKEPNSKFSPKTKYRSGHNIGIELKLSTLHPGPVWVEYACMDGHESETADSARVSWTKLPLVDGTTVIKSGRCITPSDIASCTGGCVCKFPVKAPTENCNHGLLVSLWHNTGGIPNEVFKHCADISITGGSDVPANIPGNPSPSNPSSGSTPSSPSDDGNGGNWTTILVILGCVLAISIAGGIYYQTTPKIVEAPPPRPRKHSSSATRYYNKGNRKRH